MCFRRNPLPPVHACSREFICVGCTLSRQTDGCVHGSQLWHPNVQYARTPFMLTCAPFLFFFLMTSFRDAKGLGRATGTMAAYVPALLPHVPVLLLTLEVTVGFYFASPYSLAESVHEEVSSCPVVFSGGMRPQRVLTCAYFLCCYVCTRDKGLVCHPSTAVRWGGSRPARA